jgi:hypothetical protein
LTLVLVAVAGVVLLMVAALAIDGGQAFQQRRQTQNAADASAMAGARVLDKLKYDKKTTFQPGSIRAAVLNQVTLNGADAVGTSCYLLDPNQVQVSGNICDPSIDPTRADIDEAFGIRVTPKQTRPTFFAGAFGTSSTTARATASVLIQAWVPTGVIGSPFIVCGYSKASPANPGTKAYDILELTGTRYAVKESAVGAFYNIQGSQVPTCNAGDSSFNGKGDGAQAYTGLPMWENIVTGNSFSSAIEVWVSGLRPCDDTGVYDGCGMVLPIADESREGGSDTDMHIVKWTVWMVWGDGSPSYNFPGTNGGAKGTSCRNPLSLNGGGMKYCGQLLGAGQGVVTGGHGGEIATGDELRVFTLGE